MARPALEQGWWSGSSSFKRSISPHEHCDRLIINRMNCRLDVGLLRDSVVFLSVQDWTLFGRTLALGHVLFDVMSLHTGNPTIAGHFRLLVVYLVDAWKSSANNTHQRRINSAVPQVLALINYCLSRSTSNPWFPPLSQRALLLWYVNAHNCQRHDSQHRNGHSESDLPSFHVALLKDFTEEHFTSPFLDYVVRGSSSHGDL